ncbi:hypothetical protein D3C80_2119680 [compost metagenome]
MNYPLDIIYLILLGHPVHHIQRVIQKMRIDLGLQRLQLRPLLLLPQPELLLHQLLHTIDLQEGKSAQ